MGKYPISREFFPYSLFTPPLSKPVLALAGAVMRRPGSLDRDRGLDVEDICLPGGEAGITLIRPKGARDTGALLFYVHGGGFVLKAAPYHYALAAGYARECGCVTAFVNYRLAPKHPLPAPLLDCFEAYTLLLENAERLGVDPENIGIAGDSAGAALAVGTALMLRDRGAGPMPVFQMLPYPLLDCSGSGACAGYFTDTPMWNSRLNERALKMAGADPSGPLYAYCSPAEAPDLSGLPPAYIETAEFDCLRADGTAYAGRLRALGIPVELNETRGTMHGFDIAARSPTAKSCVERRIEFMKKHFRG